MLMRSARRPFGAAIAALLLASTVPFAAVRAAEEPKAEDPVVARVDGSDIRRSDVVAAYETLPPPYRSLPFEQLYDTLLDNVISSRLMVEAARKQGLESEDDVKQRIQRAADRVLTEAYLTRLIDNAVTDEALKAAYDDFKTSFTPEEEVRARHILVATEDEAKAVKAELDKGGDFAKIAADKSTDPGAANGGDLGFFTADRMVKPFADAAFAMKPGEISDPVQSQFGWHVIKLEERRKQPVPSFEDKKQELEVQLQREAVDDALEALKADAKVERLTETMPEAPAAEAPAAEAPKS
ncbi:peptidylprolyl isomerase [Tistrella bauzanensis]|uniref:Parvulin-like PPIase n=1 Tax=Tistrella bauzanensis TaxID=657419 RepID=A0ABQ1IA79_9PROT|nr:peptidylprolyl isomerase [Tistrella bauzanensis]GGB31546.1 peptidylprolyl isomerase [Tistrella bauzanensis]